MWGTDPVVKISRSIEMAERLDAGVVVAHPPFVWQRSAVGSFAAAVSELSGRSEVRIAVENMFPIKVAGALVNSYRPHWDPVPAGHDWYTLDLSHTATSGVGRAGHGRANGWRPRAHPPGRRIRVGPRRASGSRAGFPALCRGAHPVGRRRVPGSVVAEVATRGRSPERRESDLAEALTFARWHLDQPSWTTAGGSLTPPDIRPIRGCPHGDPGAFTSGVGTEPARTIDG